MELMELSMRTLSFSFRLTTTGVSSSSRLLLERERGIEIRERGRGKERGIEIRERGRGKERGGIKQ